MASPNLIEASFFFISRYTSIIFLFQSLAPLDMRRDFRLPPVTGAGIAGATPQSPPLERRVTRRDLRRPPTTALAEAFFATLEALAELFFTELFFTAFFAAFAELFFMELFFAELFFTAFAELFFTAFTFMAFFERLAFDMVLPRRADFL